MVKPFDEKENIDIAKLRAYVEGDGKSFDRYSEPPEKKLDHDILWNLTHNLEEETSKMSMMVADRYFQMIFGLVVVYIIWFVI